jgi:hypothetical protein
MVLISWDIFQIVSLVTENCSTDRFKNSPSKVLVCPVFNSNIIAYKDFRGWIFKSIRTTVFSHQADNLENISTYEYHQYFDFIGKAKLIVVGTSNFYIRYDLLFGFFSHSFFFLFTLKKINTISPLLNIPDSPVPHTLAISHECKTSVDRLLQCTGLSGMLSKGLIVFIFFRVKRKKKLWLKKPKRRNNCDV